MLHPSLPVTPTLPFLPIRRDFIVIRKETANPCTTKPPCQAAVITDGSGFDLCHEWWKVAPKAICSLACDSGNHRWGRGPGPPVCGSHDLVNKIGSSCNTEIRAKGPGSCRSCLASGLGEGEGVWCIQGLCHTPRPEA